MMEEVEKYTKLWDLPQGYGNNWGHLYWKEIAAFLRDCMQRVGLDSNDMVLEIGGGDGQMHRKYFSDIDYWRTMDIAPNSGADIIADVSEWDMEMWQEVGENGLETRWPLYDWVVAIDMLEHLPTDRIQVALETMWKVADSGIFLISTRPDRGGKKIGTTLHMTVREANWWCMELAQHWGKVDLLRDHKGEYCIIRVES